MAKIIELKPQYKGNQSSIAKTGPELFKLAEVQNYPQSMSISPLMQSALKELVIKFNNLKQFNDEVEANTVLGALYHCVRVVIRTCQKVYPNRIITPEDILEVTHDHWNQCYCSEWSDLLYYNVCHNFKAE